MSYVVIFKSTRNALLRPGVPNWKNREDMLTRVETDGIVGPSKTSAIAQAVGFRPGSSSIIAVDLDDWKVEMGRKSTCQHCDRAVVLVDGTWIDPEADGDDHVWRETCDSNTETFTANHEPHWDWPYQEES